MLLLSIVSNLFIIYWTPHPVKVIQIVTHKKEVWFTLRCIDILSLHVLVVNLPFVSLINIFSTCLKFMDQKTTNAKAVNENPSGVSVKAERLSGPHGWGRGAGLGGVGRGSTLNPGELAVLSTTRPNTPTCIRMSSRSYTKGLLSAIIIIIVIITQSNSCILINILLLLSVRSQMELTSTLQYKQWPKQQGSIENGLKLSGYCGVV